MSKVDRREALGVLGVLGAATVATLFAAPSVRAAQITPSVNLEVVAPELRPAVVQMMDTLRTMPAFSTAGLPALRASGAKWSQPPLPNIPWEKRVIPRIAGNPDVTIYVINAKPGRKSGGILYMHGGGFVFGQASLEIKRSQELAGVLDCTIVSVEYRLAPEARYAQSLEDNYAALKWLYQHGAEIGVDPSRITVLGESAGGGHAALLSIAARDRGEVPVAFQCLVYPMLDDRTGTTRAVPPALGQILWTAKENAFGWSSFLGRTPGGALRSGVPAREPNVSGLPPTWIGVGGIDLFMLEDVHFAERLLSAAVPTELLVVPGAFHGFDLAAADTNIAKRFTASKVDALRRALTA
ncbi:MAG: alpha/beta hydrolase [Sphingomonas sp.]